MADGPVGYWRLGDQPTPKKPYPWGIKDETANGNDGAVIDSVGDDSVPRQPTGPTGIKFMQPGFHPGAKSRAQSGDTAALFDGKTGRIIVLNSDSLNPPKHLTIEAIVRWDGPTPGLKPGQQPFQQRILEKSSYPEEAQYGLSMSPDGHIQVELRIGDNTWLPAISNDDAVVSRGQWTYVAATYDGRVIQIYINDRDGGQTPGGSGTLSIKTPTPANLIESGVGIGNQTQRDRPFYGLIDEVALYAVPLSKKKILAHYRSLFTVWPPGK